MMHWPYCLRGTQLVLKSNVLAVLDLNEVNVTLENWRMLRFLGRCRLERADLLVLDDDAAEVFPVSLSCPNPRKDKKNYAGSKTLPASIKGAPKKKEN
jgi:hypothetical protein